MKKEPLSKKKKDFKSLKKVISAFSCNFETSFALYLSHFMLPYWHKATQTKQGSTTISSSISQGIPKSSKTCWEM